MATTATMNGALQSPAEGASKGQGNQERNLSRRKYEYPPAGYEAPKGTLRVHSSETHSARDSGRVLHNLTLCIKPRSESNSGCRMGRFGYWVWYQGVLRKAIWLTRVVCDYEEPEDYETTSEAEEDGSAGEVV